MLFKLLLEQLDLLLLFSLVERCPFRHETGNVVGWNTTLEVDIHVVVVIVDVAVGSGHNEKSIRVKKMCWCRCVSVCVCCD